jgi:subtilisin family serine protease
MWSEPFRPDRLPTVPGLSLPITPEWAWGASTGRGVKVAIVDSGVDGTHPLVGGVTGGVALEYDPEAPNSVRIVDGPHDDLFGHGTACAAIIRGLSPDCEIYSVRVLGERLTAKGLVFVEGLRWAIDNKMDVVNLSLSTKSMDYFGPLHELADQANFQGTILVAAANNLPSASYPSLYSSVLSVAARPGSDSLGFAYNPEPPVEFGAAGIDVDVAWLNGSVIKATGNSFAAPIIAGYVTKILGKHRGLTSFQIKTILHETADNVSGGSAS